MAENKTEILTISLKDYKKAIDDLRASLLTLNKDSEEYKKTVDEITKMQNNLDDAVKAGKKNNDALAGSYQDLSNQMAKLKAEWKATNDETKRNELGGQILEINNKLKGLDSSIGNYQRNVGDYANAWTSAFQNAGGALGTVGGKAASAVGGIKSVALAFKALQGAMGWIGVVLGVVVAAFSALSKGITGSEENTRKFQKLLTPFKATLDLIADGCSALAGWFLKLADYIGELGAKFVDFYETLPDWTKWMINPLGEVIDRTGVLNGLTEEYTKKLEQENKVLKIQNELTDKQRQNKKDLAQLQKEENELMEIYNDHTLNIKQRVEALNQANAKREQQAEKQLSLAKKELELLSEQAKLTDNDADANDKLAEAEAKVIEQEAQLAQVRSNNNKALKQAWEEEKKILDARNKFNLETAKMENIYAPYDPKYLEKQTKILQEKYNQDVENLKTNLNNKQITQKQYNERIEAMDKKLYKDQQDLLYSFYSNVENYEKEKRGKVLTLAKTYFGSNSQQLAETEVNIAQDTFFKIYTKYQEFKNLQEKLEKENKTDELKINKVYLDALEKMYFDSRYNLLVAQQKHSKQRIQDLENFYDAEKILKAKNSKDELSLEYDKWEEILKVVNKKISEISDITGEIDKERLFGKTEITIDDILDFRPLENGKVIEEQLVDFKKIFGQLMFQDEDLDQFQARLKTYVDNLKNATDDIVDERYRLEQVEKENEGIYKELHNSFFSDDELVNLKTNLELAYDEYLSMQQLIGEADEDFKNRQLQAEKKFNDAQKSLRQKNFKDALQIANATTNILGTVASYKEEKLKKELADGKISQEEAEKQFEHLKKLQIAQTWISTLAATAQIFGDSSIPSYYVKAALAAQQIVQGIATTQQIKQTTIGNADTSNGSGNIGVSTANVAPLLNEQTDLTRMTQLTVNQGEEKDTKVYILQSELEESSKQVKIREEQTTF